MFWIAVSQLAEADWTSCCWKEVLVFSLPPPVATHFCLHRPHEHFSSPLVLDYLKINRGGFCAIFQLDWLRDKIPQRHIITSANAKKSAATQRQQPDLCERTLYTHWIKLKLTNMCHCLSLLCKPTNPHLCKDTVPWDAVNQLHSSSSPEDPVFSTSLHSIPMLLLILCHL